MVKFSVAALDRFNDRSQNILQNEPCSRILKSYLKHHRPELSKVYRLWRKAHKAKQNDRALSDAMADLMDEIDDFDYTDDLDIIMNQCCDILDDKVKEHFIEYLNIHHKKS